MHRVAALLVVLVSLVAITPPAWADSQDSLYWAGYMALRTGGFKTVSARWTVPKAVRCEDDEFSTVAVWVGMGSETSGEGTVDQTGTITECREGVVEYWAFAEAYPAEAVLLFPVKPGDTIHARITMGTREFGYHIVDYNAEELRHGELPTTARGRSAEVIVEGPDGEFLTEFEPIEVRNAKINDIPIGTRDLVHWTMVDPNPRVIRAYASKLTDGGRDFTVYYRNR